MEDGMKKGSWIRRNLIELVLAGFGILCCSVAHAREPLGGRVIISSSSVAESIHADVNINDVRGISVQAVYEPLTLASSTFDDGQKSTGQVTVSDYSKLTGSTMTVGGNLLVEGVDWTAATSNAATASSLSLAINALSIVNSTQIATSDVIYTTAAFPGTIGNYALLSSSATDLVVSAAAMSGGIDADISTITAVITATGHGWTTGTSVLFQKTAGTDPTGLVSGTTYFVIQTTTNSFQLSDTSTGATAGNEIAITDLTGLGTFGLTPLDWGDASLKLQGSIDGTNFSDVSGSSVTITEAGNTVWNLVDQFYRILRFVFTPSTGATELTVKVNGRVE
jgi:hypothetical protein